MRCPKCDGFGYEISHDENGRLVIHLGKKCDNCKGLGKVEQTSPYHKNPLDDEWDDDDDDDYPYNTKDGEDYLN